MFTSPQVTMVGVTEEQYREKHGTCLCSTVRLDHVERAKASRKTCGLIRMVLNHKTKQILGVHLVSPRADEIITAAVYAIRAQMTIYDVRSITHVFPTFGETIKKLAQSFDLNLDAMACCVE
ncbi:MAG: hypothetical protein ACTSYO_08505 [Candidatus Ranarchaeia archaeon]